VTGSTGLLLAAIVAIVGPLAGYLGASRKLSGKIGTSEASQLWAESASIRHEYREQLQTSATRTTALEERVANLERRNNELARENFELTKKVSEYETTIRDLRAQVATLEAQVRTLEQGETDA
jgi:predicted RNase H-like nuclease (RuvC/YqgF family)